MAKFKKKPDIVDAFKWTGGPDQTEDPEWIVEALENGSVKIINVPGQNPDLFMITDVSGFEQWASPGDYIVLGPGGGIYPLSPDEFEAHYEPV
jgi:hypothetical protein